MAYSYALVLTVRSPGKTFKLMSRTKQQRIALGMLYLYSPNYARRPMVYPHDRFSGYVGYDIIVSA